MRRLSPCIVKVIRRPLMVPSTALTSQLNLQFLNPAFVSSPALIPGRYDKITRGCKTRFIPLMKIFCQNRDYSDALLACVAVLFYVPSLTSSDPLTKPSNGFLLVTLHPHVDPLYLDDVKPARSLLLSRIPTDGANCGTQACE